VNSTLYRERCSRRVHPVYPERREGKALSRIALAPPCAGLFDFFPLNFQLHVFCIKDASVGSTVNLPQVLYLAHLRICRGVGYPSDRPSLSSFQAQVSSFQTLAHCLSSPFGARPLFSKAYGRKYRGGGPDMSTTTRPSFLPLAQLGAVCLRPAGARLCVVFLAPDSVPLCPCGETLVFVAFRVSASRRNSALSASQRYLFPSSRPSTANSGLPLMYTPPKAKRITRIGGISLAAALRS
jgi:hypothetical protein